MEIVPTCSASTSTYLEADRRMLFNLCCVCQSIPLYGIYLFFPTLCGFCRRNAIPPAEASVLRCALA